MSTIESRECEISEVLVGDFIDVPGGGYGEVGTIIRHGHSIGDGTVDWYTFRVYLHRERDRADPYTTTCGPYRGTCKVVNWS